MKNHALANKCIQTGEEIMSYVYVRMCVLGLAIFPPVLQTSPSFVCVCVNCTCTGGLVGWV